VKRDEKIIIFFARIESEREGKGSKRKE